MNYREIKNLLLFLRESFIFLIPLVILLGFPFIILHYTGELVTTSEIVDKQIRNPNIVYGLAYSDNTSAYKLEMAKKRSPEILAIGASTAMQFSSLFFNNPNQFYNAGGAISRPEEFNKLAERLFVDVRPSIIIVSIPHSYFRMNAPQNIPDSLFLKTTSKEERFFESWSRVWKDLYLGKIPIDLISNHNIEMVGLQSVLHGAGFLGDGSYTWGSYLQEERAGTLISAQRERFQKEMSVLKEGKATYTKGGSNPNPETFKHIENFLVLMKENNIHVIGFLPPSFTPEILEELKKPEYDSQYLFKIAPELNILFNKYDYPFFDLSDSRSFGASNEEYYDINHASRKAYARIVVKLAKNDDRLQKQVNIQELEARIAKSVSNLDI